MSTPLKILIYISASSDQATEEELETILQQARRANSDRGITGMLMYFEGHILQIIEGSIIEVDLLFHRIRNDQRHKNVSIIYEAPICERIFPEFTMGFKLLRSSEFTSIGSFNCTPFLQPLIHEADMNSLRPEIRKHIEAFRQVVGLNS